MAEYETTKRQVIEGILENESLTDGLPDEHAQLIIHWCLDRVEAFQSSDPQALVDYGQHLARQARTVTRIVRHIQDGDAVSRIQRRLQRVTDDVAQQQRFLELVKQDGALQDYIQVLLRMIERD